ncbi:Uncharacterised protein [uncultured archaeon]|nr:Uncharacterised protein [uncultured archaeon]
MFRDTYKESDERNSEWGGVGGDYDYGLRRIRSVSPNIFTSEIGHHETAHGVHHHFLGNEKFAEFASLGGWRVQTEGGSERDIRDYDTIELMPDERWVRPPATSVAREYGIKNPVEDFATLYGEYTGDCRPLLHRARTRERMGDPVLMEKVRWMMDNVFTDPAAGVTYTYDFNGVMQANPQGDVNALIEKVLDARDRELEGHVDLSAVGKDLGKALDSGVTK